MATLMAPALRIAPTAGLSGESFLGIRQLSGGLTEIFFSRKKKNKEKG
jgi:hypothetical protein